MTTNPLFKLLPASETGIHFNNRVKDTKEFNIFKYRNFYNGGGVAIGDVNHDGRPDIFFTSNQHENQLYLNKGNWKFEEVAAKSGLTSTHHWHTGVTMVDINGDGWLDIYVCNGGNVTGMTGPMNYILIRGMVSLKKKHMLMDWMIMEYPPRLYFSTMIMMVIWIVLY